MSFNCNVCGGNIGIPIYQSPDDTSITTLNKVIEGKTKVYFCGHCGHLQTSELPNLDAYYTQEYEINLKSKEDDQIYDVFDGRIIYRAEHQAKVLLDKVSFFPGCRVLDYGCAKAPTLKAVLKRYPEIKPFVFDVTDKYLDFWQDFPQLPEWAIFEPNPAWYHSMDVILSFYVLEHIADLQKTLEQIKLLLKPGGVFYFVVPNVYENIADFIVADHTNHFSSSSLHYMLETAGFDEISINDQSHTSAFVVKATYMDNSATKQISQPHSQAIQKLYSRVQEMTAYWQEIVVKIRQFEASVPVSEPFAIYGAGFYGSFITATLLHPEKISCYIDQNRFLQGTLLNNKPIVAPENLGLKINHVLVGMNPRYARSNIQAVESWKNRRLTYLFL